MKYRLVWLLQVGFYLSYLQAGEIEELDEITVTAKPAGFQSLAHTSQPVTVLSGKDLTEKKANTIGETLALEPGISASDFGHGASRPVIRGLGGSRLRILQGGIGSLDVSELSADHHVSINPLQANQIEVLRGPATLLYGSGNSAGVVNIVTNRIPESLPEFQATLDSRYQSALSGKTLGLMAEGGINNLALHFDYLRYDTEDYEAADKTIINSGVETNDLNIGGSILGDFGFFGVSINHYESVYGIPFNPDAPDELPFIELDQDRFDFAGQLVNPLPGLTQLKLRAAYNDYTHTEFEGPGMPGTVFFNDEWEGRIEANHRLIGPWTGVIGLQYRNRSFAAIGDEAFVPSTKQDSLGVFVLEDTDWQNWHFELGGRFETQKMEPTIKSEFPEVVHNVYSLSAGTNWFFTDDLVLGINASRSQRAPALEELFANGPHLASETFEVGDPALEAETANNIDFALSKPEGRWTWKINLFANYLEDFIFQQFKDVNKDGVADRVDETGTLGAGDLLSVKITQDDAVFYGAEAEVYFNLYEEPLAKYTFRIFGDWVRGELTNGEKLPRISPARLGGSLIYGNNRWRANLDIINVFAQTDVAPLETDTDGYLMANASLGYDIEFGALKANLLLQLTNLLNEDAQRHMSFIKERAPLPGRSVALGLKLDF